jgi:hypothetical protein
MRRSKTYQQTVAMGQKRRFDRLPFTSGLPPSTDIVGVRRHVANVPIPESAALPIVVHAWPLEARQGALERTIEER